MPTIIEDPGLPPANPADPSGLDVSDSPVSLRLTDLAGRLNAFGERLVVQLQRLADKSSVEGIQMEQPLDMNHNKIENVGASYQLTSIVPLSLVEDLLDV